MLNEKYSNSLNLILASDEILKGKILEVIKKMPEEMKDAIAKDKDVDLIKKNGVAWNCVNTDEDLSISVGDAKKCSKEYMNLYLRNIGEDRLKKMASSNDYEFLGFVTFYIDDLNPRKKAAQLRYDFYIERQSGDYYLRIKTSMNTQTSENKEKIENGGYTDLVNSIASKRAVKVKLSDIVASKGRK